ncbi:hypothetical protein [Nonomuraea soli]|uniref:Uncharacterized protein n=1 Tax=Nonomuraea soli TaxID=1032476 RepID=A0A7W0HW52_9ACTN|nr:hypothetical protein [Nonomuraea soli]MBA2897742.1 hypothetical protein [Nonomuraea soli]
METITRDGLLDSARDFAGRALEAHLQDDTRGVFLHAATSLEHLCKAYLCSLHPALLLELKQDQFHSLLHLTGNGAKATKTADKIRTVSGRVALARVEEILKPLPAPKDHLERLIDVRDGVVHAGLLDDSKRKETLAAWLRMGNRLFEELQVPSQERWGNRIEVVEALISDHLSEVERDISGRIATARLRLETIYRDIPEELRGPWQALRRTTIHLALTPDPDQERDEDLLYETCPACADAKASVLYDVEVDFDVEPDGLGGYDAVTVGEIRLLHAKALECGVCGLRLTGPDEFTAAGLDVVVEDQADDDGDAMYDAWKDSQLDQG